LFSQAEEKYAAALRIKADLPDTLTNWGILLLLRASRVDGVQLRSLLDQAEKKLQDARSCGSLKAAYNLACVAGLRGKAEAAAEWLRTANAEGDLLNCAHIAVDSDFNLVRDDVAFTRALKELGC
jgi:Flp pilus assembly protein TadD